MLLPLPPMTGHDEPKSAFPLSPLPVSLACFVQMLESLGDIPPVEFEALHAPTGPLSANGSVARLAPRAADGLRITQILALGTGERETGPDRALPALTITTDQARSAPHEAPDPRARRRRFAPLALWARCAHRRHGAHYDPMTSSRTHQTSRETRSGSPTGPGRGVLRVEHLSDDREDPGAARRSRGRVRCRSGSPSAGSS